MTIGFQLGPWRLVLQMLFEPRDPWVGLYWTRKHNNLHLYLSVLPALPLHVVLGRNA